MTEADSDRELLHATLDVWHPDCWGITATDEVGSGLLGHGASVSGESGYERCTVYGETDEHVAQAIDAADDSAFIRAIEPLDGGLPEAHPPAIGRSRRDVFIEYDATEGIGSAFLSRGFVLNGTYRIEDGLETWDLLVYATRSSFERSLAATREERDADIALQRLSTDPPSSRPWLERRRQRLTARQREAFLLARRRGYYEWPRNVSAGDLATELGVSKATFLEHLRTAEATLLGTED